MVLGVSAGAFGAGGWGDIFPPLTPEDVEALGGAADAVDAEEGDGADGTVGWDNPRSGTHGTLQRLRSFDRDGLPCRQYRMFIKVQGYEPYSAEPVMCKVEGKWKFAARD
jgi:hypothetical protein